MEIRKKNEKSNEITFKSFEEGKPFRVKDDGDSIYLKTDLDYGTRCVCLVTGEVYQNFPDDSQEVIPVKGYFQEEE